MKLTDRKKSLSGAEGTDLIHIVKTGDTSQNSAGSSYKAELIDYKDILNDNFVRKLTINISSLPPNYTLSQVVSYVNSSIPNNNKTILPTDSKWNIVIINGSNVDKIYEIQNKGKGISSLVDDDLLEIYSFDKYISNLSFDNSNYDLTITRNDGEIFTQNLAILATDMTITGGTYNNTTGVATFTNNTGGTFSVTGFLVNENYQKEINSSYVLLDIDNDYTILINNGSNPITITVPSGLIAKINVGFIQQGSGEVTFVPSGTNIRTPLVGGFKIKGINYNAYLEQIGSSNDYHLLGNLKV